MNYITIILAALVVILVAKFVLGFNPRRVLELIINAVLGLVILWLLNTFGASLGINIPLNIITALVVGVLGVPGVIILVLLNLSGII